MIYVHDNIEEISSMLHAGKVILFPTDTIWSIGCDATNEQAIRRIYEIKNGDLSRPLSLLVDSIEMLKRYVTDIHPRIETLINLHERPLTIVYPESKNLPRIINDGGPSIGIRIVRDPFCRELISSLEKPLVISSANKAEETYPAHFGEISSDILKAMDYVVKHRQEDRSDAEPSVVATYAPDGQLEFLRS